MKPLETAEYVEQAYLFRLLRQRHEEQLPMQDLLRQIGFELLSTTKLPMAIDFLATELRHSGLMSPAMERLGHYFTPFQTFLIAKAEEEAGRFTMGAALQILEAEAEYRTRRRDPMPDPRDGSTQRPPTTPQGMFFYHFEAISRNRLSYDGGLLASSQDPIFTADWARWILVVRNQLGLVDLADLIFLSSEEYRDKMLAAGKPFEVQRSLLFGNKEGRIALGNRGRDPLFLFAAMQRHLGYPEVPRPKPLDENRDLIPQMARRIERLESRLKLLEDERRGGVDITKFYEKPGG